MEEKIKIKVSKRSNAIVNFFGREIIVNPIITIPEQKNILSTAFNSMFSEGKKGIWDEYFFEVSFRYGVLSFKTNIDLSEMRDDDLGEIMWGEFYDKVSSSIINYKEVKDSIYLSLNNEIKRYAVDNSISGIVNSLVEKVLPILEQFKDISPEKLDEFKNMANDIIEKIKQEPITSVIGDMNRNSSSNKEVKDN